MNTGITTSTVHHVLGPKLGPELRRVRSGPPAWGYADIVAGIVADYDPRTSTAQPLRLLEAGGGSDCWLPLPLGAEITTIDISPEQLAKNTYAHEKLLGDLETYDYGDRRYDLIVCWDVLEHLRHPEAALQRLAAVLSPDGQIVIKGPLQNTLKGLVTRYTPHTFHVLFYRHVLGSEHAGKPGYAPFKAHLAAASAPETITQLLARDGVTVDTLRGFETIQVTAIAAKSRALLAVYRAGEVLLSVLTLGRFKSRMTDFFLIAHRK